MLLLSLVIVSVLWNHRRAGITTIFGVYGSGAVSYLVTKLALAAAYRPAHNSTRTCRWPGSCPPTTKSGRDA